MDMNYKTNIFSLGNEIFEGMSSYVKQELSNKYDTLKILKYVVSSTYPQIVFSEERNQTINESTRNEIRERNVEFEINVYAKNAVIQNEQMDASNIVDEITNVVVYYLQKICKFKNVNLTSRLTDFDSKGDQSMRSVIRFSVKWLQDYNKIV